MKTILLILLCAISAQAEVVRSVGSLIYKDNVNSRVGINLLNPAYTLDVLGDINYTGAITGSGASMTGVVHSPSESVAQTFSGALTATSSLTVTGATGEFGVRISSNIYTIGYSSASSYYGSGANLTALTAANISAGTFGTGVLIPQAGVNLSTVTTNHVLKAGDTMTGPLTLSGSTLTVTDNAFSVGGSTLVVSGGLVGVGTASPATKLHCSSCTVTVDGNNVTPLAILTNVANSAYIQSSLATGNAEFAVKNNQGDNSFIALDSYGSSASGSILGKNKANQVSLMASGSNLASMVIGTYTDDPLVFAQNNVTVATFTSTAFTTELNVGIGTASPDNKLHVSSGTITIDGTGAPTVGYGLCLATGGKLGHCTTVLAADGTCTCTTP